MFAGSTFRNWIRHRTSNRIRSLKTRPIRLQLAALEERAVPATYTVNTLVDEDDGIGTGGVSLRDAIKAANVDASPGPHTIDFSVTGTINLTLNQLSITGAQGLNIVGPGSGSLTISGGAKTTAN